MGKKKAKILPRNLELIAKAAGFDFDPTVQDVDLWGCYPGSKSQYKIYWNPERYDTDLHDMVYRLTKDGKIRVSMDRDGVTAYYCHHGIWVPCVFTYENYGPLAYNNAVLQAAEEYGKLVKD